MVHLLTDGVLNLIRYGKSQEGHNAVESQGPLEPEAQTLLELSDHLPSFGLASFLSIQPGFLLYMQETGLPMVLPVSYLLGSTN